MDENIVWDDEVTPGKTATERIVWDDQQVDEPPPISFGAGIRPEQIKGKRKPQASDYKGAFDDTSLSGDVLAGLTGGVYRAGLGVAQLGAETVDYYSGKLGHPTNLGEPLREREQEDRAIMDALKSKYGGKGITNPVSIAEFGGETVPWMLAPAGKAVKGGKHLLDLAKTGAKYGAVGGATVPLTPEESRAKAVALGTAGGAILGPAVSVASNNIVKPLANKAINKLYQLEDKYALRQANPKLYEQVYEKDAFTAQAEPLLRRIAPAGAGAKKSPKAASKVVKNDADAILTITDIAGELPIVKEMGRLPQTQDELLTATGQAKQELIGWLNAAEQSAGEGGVTVDISGVLSQLKGIMNDPKNFSKTRRTQAQAMYNDYSEAIADGTMLSPSQAVNRLAGLNNDLKQVFSGANVKGDAPEIISLVANTLRKELNDTIESSTGAEFGALRKSWGELNGLEERTLRSFEQTANREAKKGISLLDILSYEQLLHGNFFQAAGTKVMGKARDRLMSADPKVKKLFKLAEKQVQKQDKRLKKPVMSTGTAAEAVEPPLGYPGSSVLGQKVDRSGKGGVGVLPETPRQNPQVSGFPTKTTPSSGRPYRPQTSSILPPAENVPAGLEKYLDYPQGASPVGGKLPRRQTPVQQESIVPKAPADMPKNLVKGTIYRGYKYIGGDPSQPESWRSM